VKDGAEGGVDCGAACPLLCVSGSTCGGPGDCVSHECLAGVCTAASCGDGVKNGGESDTDCGGPCALTCPTGATCNVYTDCASHECAGAGIMTCAAPSCFDSAKNGDETDVNCGGSCAQKCPPNYACLLAADCIGNVCNAVTKKCDPTCNDGYQNGGETDVDCGGPCPVGCQVGWHCSTDADCAQGNCSADGHCYPP